MMMRHGALQALGEGPCLDLAECDPRRGLGGARAAAGCGSHRPRWTADGAPLAGARMYLVRSGSGMAGRANPSLRALRSRDADGRANLGCVRARGAPAVLVSHVARTASAFERFADVPPVVELGPGPRPSRVGAVDAEGAGPVAGVRFAGSVVGGGMSSRRCSAHLGLSGPDGRFPAHRLHEGQRVAAHRRRRNWSTPGLSIWRAPWDLGSIVLRAPETYWIPGRPIRAVKTPIPGGARLCSGGGEATTTDRDGVRAGVTPFQPDTPGRRERLQSGAIRVRWRRSPRPKKLPCPGLPALPCRRGPGGAGATAEEPLVLRPGAGPSRSKGTFVGGRRP